MIEPPYEPLVHENGFKLIADGMAWLEELFRLIKV